MGEAAAVKYSTDKEKYHFIEIGVTNASAGDKNVITSAHSESTIVGFAYNLKLSAFSFLYSIKEEKGGVFISIPFTIPSDLGIRTSIVQWLYPAYFGAGVSFVGGYYSNKQGDSLEPKIDDPDGRYDCFILYDASLGIMFDITEIFTFGVYANYERMAFNSGGSQVKSYGLYLDIFRTGYGEENYPAYAKRGNVMTLGFNTLFETKVPFGFYAEYTPPKLMFNDGFTKFHFGFMIFY